jgi:hypothetical protein
MIRQILVTGSFVRFFHRDVEKSYYRNQLEENLMDCTHRVNSQKPNMPIPAGRFNRGVGNRPGLRGPFDGLPR